MAPSPKMAGVTSALGGHLRIHVFQVFLIFWYFQDAEHLLVRELQVLMSLWRSDPSSQGTLIYVKQQTILCSAFAFCKNLVQLAWNKPMNCTETEILLVGECVWVQTGQGSFVCWAADPFSFPPKYWGTELLSFKTYYWWRSRASAAVRLSESASRCRSQTLATLSRRTRVMFRIIKKPRISDNRWSCVHIVCLFICQIFVVKWYLGKCRVQGEWLTLKV